MTRSDLIKRINDRFPAFTNKDIETSISALIGGIRDTLSAGGRIEVRGFGSFSLNYRPPRTGRNPKTGESVAVPAKRAPHFRASKALAEAVDSSASGRSR